MVDVATAAANSALFDGIRPEERSAMLTCLGAQTKTVRKGEFLVLAQDEVRYIGVVLSGEVHMIHEDRWGDKAVLAVIKKAGLFGETFVCGTILQSLVTIPSRQNDDLFDLTISKSPPRLYPGLSPSIIGSLKTCCTSLPPRTPNSWKSWKSSLRRPCGKKLLTFFSLPIGKGRQSYLYHPRDAKPAGRLPLCRPNGRGSGNVAHERRRPHRTKSADRDLALKDNTECCQVIGALRVFLYLICFYFFKTRPS